MMKRRITLIALCAVSLLALSRSARMFTTTADGAKKLDCKAVKLGKAATKACITLQPDVTYQEMDGFGFAITYSACYNLLKMKPEARHALLVKTFSKTQGYGTSYVRTSIGCSDFSSTEYTLCDEPGLENFRLYADELDYVIPVMKEILAINPDVKLMAAPWTCPRWMKVNNLKERKPHNSWTAGHLNPDFYADYAQYFVRFVQAFKEQGIDVYAVTPQNEPLNPGNCASLVMNWDEQAAFLHHLAPAFARAGLKTKIYTFDHNYNYDNLPDQEDYPVKVYGALDSNIEGASLIAGSAWHNYGGHTSELDDIRQKAPGKEMIFTEASIGTWNDGRNLQKRLLDDMDWMVLPCVNRGSKAVMVWNYMLDLAKGPNMDGGCQTCYGAIDIDQSDYATITPNSHFYVLCHMSAVVQPGAVRIGLDGGEANMMMSAFRNPDGSYAVVLASRASTTRTLTFNVPNLGAATIDVPARSVVSLQMSKGKVRVL